MERKKDIPFDSKRKMMTTIHKGRNGYLSITKGAPADLVIFAETELWTVRKEDFASKAVNSPFVGWELPGKVHYTICSGKIVYEG